MKKLMFFILFVAIHYVSGSSEYNVLYIAEARAIIQAPERADVQFEAFASHLSLLESSDRWQVINRTGCMGKYQFTAATLAFLGFTGITPERFRQNPDIFPEAMQERALRALIKYHTRCLKRYERYIGQVVKGVRITQAGLLAACHLGGFGGVKRFLTSNDNPQDVNGTRVSHYLNEFQRYNV